MKGTKFGHERTPKGGGGEQRIRKPKVRLRGQWHTAKSTGNVTGGLLRIERSIVQLEDV